MATSLKNRKNKLLALLMALMMTSSFAALAACGDDEDTDSTTDDSTSESTVTETDTARINNGSFEFVDWNNGKNLIITSPTSWSRSTNSASSGTAVSSKSASGIINTADEAWKKLTKSTLPEGTKAPTTANEASELWSQMSPYDKLVFYKAWDDADYDETVSEQDFYDADKDKFNIDIDDIPVDKDGEIIQNPGTHKNAGEDTNVLMIHNAYTNGVGTAQKFTSGSTITLQSGTSAKVSLWVKTSNLTYNGGNTATNDRGAYIGITHTVGGKSLDQMQVKNINTELMDEADENGWVQYTFYLQGCSYASSTFTMVLGLGQSGGTDRFEYVEGYAFFDDVECEIISNSDYEKAVDPKVIPEVTLDTDAEKKVFRCDDTNADYRNITTYALNLTTGAADFQTYSLPATVPALTEQKKNKTTYVAAIPKNGLPDNYELYNGLGFDISSDVNGVFDAEGLKTEAASNKYVAAALKKGFGYDAETKAFSEYPFANTEKTLLLLSAHGANYTAKITDAQFTLAKGEKMAISFFVKTSDMLGITSANVTVRYAGGAASIANIDTTGISTVDIDGDNGEDIYKGWQQCFVFVENDTDADSLTFSLEFSIGPTSIVNTTKANYFEGWAAFTGFEIATNMQDAFDYASSGTYAKVVSLPDPNEETFSSSIFDSAAYVTGTEDIKTGIADLRNYIGVVGGSGYVTNDPSADRSKNSNPYAGLISKEYSSEYVKASTTIDSETGETVPVEDYWYNVMNLNEAKLSALFGDSTQPLLIYNNEKSAYGFIATSTSTISSYTAISVRVKVSKGAVATVYLTDMDDATREGTLSIDRRVTYWYDANGNVCKEPGEDGFKKSDIILELQENGLYQARSGGAYYANLQAYPQYGQGVDLLVAEGGVEYNYNSYWNNEGVDGIAYYYANGKYYADAAKTIEVKDFSQHGSIQPRYEAAKAKDLSVTVAYDENSDDKDEWKTITFYVGAGAEEKNYRLEVWSGSRDGKVTSAAGSYVLFDTNTAGSLDATSYQTLADGALEYFAAVGAYLDKDGNALDGEELKDALKADGKLMYTAYSFYDDAKFLRYNADLDENKLGNSYDDYDSTSASYAEVISYLYYENSDLNAITVFANFTQNDVTVPVDVVTEDADDTVTEEEEDSDELNLGMLISSLAVAGVLVGVLMIVGVRKILKKRHRKSVAAARPTRYKPEKVKASKEEAKDENDPYND